MLSPGIVVQYLERRPQRDTMLCKVHLLSAAYSHHHRNTAQAVTPGQAQTILPAGEKQTWLLLPVLKLWIRSTEAVLVPQEHSVSPLACIPPHLVLPNLAGFAAPGTTCSSLVWTTDLQQSAQTYLLHANLLMLQLEEGNRRLDGKCEALCMKTLLSCVALLWKW